MFAGTGVVGQHFKAKGHQVIANDLQYYSFVLNKNYIGNHKILQFLGLEAGLEGLKNVEAPNREIFICAYLDKLDLNEGFIYQNYCLGGTINQEFARQYFSDQNGKKTDSIRCKIEEWKTGAKINDDEYYFLLATLIENIDKVANTASVYGAFLKKLKKTAEKEFNMKPASFSLCNNQNKVYNQDIEKLIESVQGDVLYLDPPYNHR